MRPALLPRSPHCQAFPDISVAPISDLGRSVAAPEEAAGMRVRAACRGGMKLDEIVCSCQGALDAHRHSRGHRHRHRHRLLDSDPHMSTVTLSFWSSTTTAMSKIPYSGPARQTLDWLGYGLTRQTAEQRQAALGCPGGSTRPDHDAKLDDNGRFRSFSVALGSLRSIVPLHWPDATQQR